MTLEVQLYNRKCESRVKFITNIASNDPRDLHKLKKFVRDLHGRSKSQIRLYPSILRQFKMTILVLYPRSMQMDVQNVQIVISRLITAKPLSNR
jgi:hypothetical protein